MKKLRGLRPCVIPHDDPEEEPLHVSAKRVLEEIASSFDISPLLRQEGGCYTACQSLFSYNAAKIHGLPMEGL